MLVIECHTHFPYYGEAANNGYKNILMGGTVKKVHFGSNKQYVCNNNVPVSQQRSCLWIE